MTNLVLENIPTLDSSSNESRNRRRKKCPSPRQLHEQITLIAQEHTRAHTSSPPHVSLHLRIRAGRFESVTGVEIYEASMYEDLSAKVLIFPLLC